MAGKYHRRCPQADFGLYSCFVRSVLVPGALCAHGNPYRSGVFCTLPRNRRHRPRRRLPRYRCRSPRARGSASRKARNPRREFPLTSWYEDRGFRTIEVPGKRSRTGLRSNNRRPPGAKYERTFEEPSIPEPSASRYQRSKGVRPARAVAQEMGRALASTSQQKLLRSAISPLLPA